ncbi:MAG: transposase, partial [Actinomycetaceae bacterium]|nr:transposase [Actinomycetaceae bacterium]
MVAWKMFIVAEDAAYRLQYHIVWCTKYRRKALVGAVRDAAIATLLEIARSQGTRIVAH